MSTINKEKLTLAPNIDDKPVVAVESAAVNILVQGQSVLLNEFMVASVPVFLNAFVETVDLIVCIPHVFLTRAALPDEVPTFGLFNHILDELNVFPFPTVLEAIS